MGQTLSEPVTTKNSHTIEDERLWVGVSDMQGWRLTMEDAHIADLKLPGLENQPLSLFSVFDGHGGSAVAEFAGKNVSRILASQPALKEKKYGEAMTKTYLQTDEELLKDEELMNDPSGATAISCLIAEDKICVANSGDSRCIISVNGNAHPMSIDHKPSLESEADRIRDAGGFVEFGRVNGNLALSRAIGDFEFKGQTELPPEKQIVTANPEIMEYELTKDLDFAIVACDGIWDCISNEDIVQYVGERIVEGKSMEKICEDVIDFCLAPTAFMGAVGCDNMSIIIVAFLLGRSKEEWVAHVKKNLKERTEPITPKAPNTEAVDNFWQLEDDSSKDDAASA